MMSMLFFICLFVISISAMFSADSEISDSQFSFKQFKFEKFVDSSSDAISGNVFGVETINNLDIDEDEFGVESGHHNQTKEFLDFGDDFFENSFLVDSLSNSSIIAEQVAGSNLAKAADGDANAGNIFEVSGDVTDSKIDITQVALYNSAISDTGDANSGNILDLQEVYGGSIEHSQSSFGNSATSNSGDAISGNILNLGNLSGRKLLKFVN